MKTIIEYSDSVDDQMALKRVMKATDMACVLFKIKINMKKKMVHMLDVYNATDAEYDLLDKVWECINDEFESHKIHVDELID
tara:strand:- start:542 stop:787 length:246 start_codon:yes stop_codon:yes gene_type:complete